MKVMKILVPLDGSPEAEAALPKAVELVKQNGAKIVLVRAVDPATLAGVGFTPSHVAAINEAAEYLQTVAAQLQNEGFGLVGRSVWYAAAGPAIVEAARTVRPDFIVMVSRGADRLIPMVLIAAEQGPAETLAERTVARETEIVHARRVLVALDGSRPADRVVSAILRLADCRYVNVLLVRVVAPTPSDAVERSRHTAANSGRAGMNEARESMASIAAQLRARGVRVMTHIRRGKPAPEILAAAREAGVDFIAVMTHSRSELDQLPFDSVSEAVFRGADIPVSMVPSVEHRLGARTDHDRELEACARVA